MTVILTGETIMSITKNEAETALRDAEKAEEHSLTLHHYEVASPYLLLWGALWIIAGIISVISPENAGTGWLIVDTIGIVATGYLVARDAQRFTKHSARSEGLRYIAAVVVMTVFLGMTFTIFNPVSGIQIQSFITVLIAAIYMIMGLWTGYKLTVIGAILAVLVVSALFLAPAQFPLIVSILGGSALIAGGLWMRRA